VRRFAFLVLAVALAGCGGSSKPSGPAPATLVQQTIAATGKQKSFHFKLNVDHPAPSTSGLSLSFAEGDVLVPDELKANAAGTFNGIPITTQIVFFGPKQYILNPLSSAWQSFSTKTSPLAFFSPAKGVLAAVKGATGLSDGGTATVGGVGCYRLLGKIKARDVTAFLGNPASDREADAEIYVGKDDSLLRKLTLSGPIAAGEPKDIRRTVVLSKFGERVTIEAPAAG
jgi:hypothetical protein